MKKSFIEFDFECETGLKVTVNAEAIIGYEDNYSADIYDHKNYPSRLVNNLKYKLKLNDGTVIPDRLLSEDDHAQIEDYVFMNIKEEKETESDFYDQFDD